ncbi:MAG TPA: tRNA lysidine(34) synthetase TilS [Ktedonobacteraceae bacterium]|nr:tRNA lysidine(34) synthetase TilS [Ktedonobacteraceae bacterium]
MKRDTIKGRNTLERVSAYIERHRLLPEQGEIVVAVSGGADSLCLLHLLLQICGPGKRYPGVSLHAAHLDHMLRAPASANDAHIVARLMETWGVPFTPGKIDVAALAKTEKRSLEEAARIARYSFLRQVAQGKYIAVAHHANDQAETLVLHWLRGSGLSGQVGMLPRQQDIIRPLLEITRAETLAYCQEHGITPVEDASNSDPHFLRNRIRHEVLPLLEELNPGIVRTLLRNAEVARVDLDWLEAQVDACWSDVVVSEQADTVKLNVHALLTLPLSLQRHLLRRVTAYLCEGQSPLEPRHLLLIERLLNEQSTRQERELHLPQRLRVLSQNGYLTIQRLSTGADLVQRSTMSSDQERENDFVILPLPGTVRVPGTPWRARAEILPERLAAQILQAPRRESKSEIGERQEYADYHSVYIDGDGLGTRVFVRTRRPGDRIQPLGMRTEKKVQDIFIDNRVPRSQRATLPLFFSDAHCLWVAGSCLDHRVRLTPTTRRVVRLSIQPLEE